MQDYTKLRHDVLAEISHRVVEDEVVDLLLQLLPLIPEGDEVNIFIKRETAEELRKFKDCYAPLLRHVAVLCDIALDEL